MKDKLIYFEIIVRKYNSSSFTELVNTIHYVLDETELSEFKFKFNKDIEKYTNMAQFHCNYKKNEDSYINSLVLFWCGEIVSITEKSIPLKNLAISYVNKDFEFIKKIGVKLEEKIKNYILSFIM